jgi:hypothetical protein
MDFNQHYYVVPNEDTSAEDYMVEKPSKAWKMPINAYSETAASMTRLILEIGIAIMIVWHITTFRSSIFRTDSDVIHSSKEEFTHSHTISLTE